MSQPRILPAGAMSGRYIRLFKVAGWPHDYFYELDEAKEFAARRNAPAPYGVNFYEEQGNETGNSVDGAARRVLSTR